MAVTMEQVAKRADVSLKTVSRVVNGEEYVSLETREKVIRVIEELGYVPNLAARRLSSGKAMAIGVVLGWAIDSPYSSSLVHNVFVACNQYGYGFTLFSTDENVSNQVLQACLGKQVDGIILDTKSSLNENFKGQLDTLRVPYLIIHPSCVDGSCDASYVTIDDYESAKEAVSYLVELGHNSIGCIFEKTNLSQEIDRLRGYRDVLTDAGIPFTRSFVDNESIGGINGGFSSASRLIEKNRQLSAIFCGTDEIAMGAMSAIWQSGRKIPDDISVVGFDDIRFAAMLVPPLTTIRQPTDQIADAAVTHLIQMIDDPSTEPISIVLPTQLIVRETCKAL
jgi:LacI family transcriptional regulator